MPAAPACAWCRLVNAPLASPQKSPKSESKPAGGRRSGTKAKAAEKPSPLVPRDVAAALPADEGEEAEVHTVAAELAALIFLVAGKWPSLDEAAAAPAHCMASHEEVAALKQAAAQGGSWRQHTLTHLSRVYPAAARADSSNFDPLPFWGCGVQARTAPAPAPCAAATPALLPSHPGICWILK